MRQTLAYPGLFLPAWGRPAQLGGIDSSELTGRVWGRPPGRLTQTSSASGCGPLLLSSSLGDLWCAIFTPSQLPAGPRALSLHFLLGEIISQVDQPVGPVVS